ncbi:MAG: hypothetical protein ACR2JB_01105 [Bryobacteraceae bacterium]
MGQSSFAASLTTTAPPGKEVQVTRIGPSLAAQRRSAWEHWYGPVAAARRGRALWQTLSWAVFAAAYVGAVIFVSSGLKASAGSSFSCWQRARACPRT